MRSSRKKTTFIVDSFSELPDEIKKRIIKSGITQEEGDKHIEVLLNIVHFKTKQNFYTTAQMMAHQNSKARPRRHNKGHSLIDKAIVSVNSLQQETEELLATDSTKINYKNIAQVGKGGFGRVYVANSELDRDVKVAIKRVPHEVSKQKRKNFQEIRFLKYCNNHPNIVQFLRAFQYREGGINEMWFVTEYLDGGTLTRAVSVHKFTEPQIAYVGREVLCALQFLHANHLAHRDLKSSNIMLEMNGNIKLIDFGLCSDISQGEVVHMVGSPFWMPPEMISKKPHGLGVDLWSFGICTMEMANGHPPNRKSALLAMFVAATSGYPEPFESNHWSNEFYDFVTRCLQIEPEARADVPTLQKLPFFLKCSEKSEMEDLCKTIFTSDKVVDTDNST